MLQPTTMECNAPHYYTTTTTTTKCGGPPPSRRRRRRAPKERGGGGGGGCDTRVKPMCKLCGVLHVCPLCQHRCWIAKWAPMRAFDLKSSTKPQKQRKLFPSFFGIWSFWDFRIHDFRISPKIKYISG